MISKCLQTLGLQPRISNVFLEQFFLTAGQKNFGNKIPWFQKLFRSFTVWINCSSDLKNFENSRPSASNFKKFSRSLEQFLLTVGQNNFGNYLQCGTITKKIVTSIFFSPFSFLFFEILCKRKEHYSMKRNNWYFVTKIVLTYCEKKLF